ncbi:MAG: hypothetical protein IPM18_07415 [Phycisphaerales bacterium]|nr:hypothetical protein [Phycisphaerales bacterium]
MAAGFLGVALALVQVPLCILGFFRARRLLQPNLALVYAAHLALTVVGFVLAETGAPMALFHLLRFA